MLKQMYSNLFESFLKKNILIGSNKFLFLEPYCPLHRQQSLFSIRLERIDAEASFAYPLYQSFSDNSSFRLF